jgi:hypothetical protein
LAAVGEGGAKSVIREQSADVFCKVGRVLFRDQAALILLSLIHI